MHPVQIFLWWLILQSLGWAAMPIAFRYLRWLPERGYVFSKALGLLLVSYLVWAGASTGFLCNDFAAILAAILAVAAISAWILVKGSEPDGTSTSTAIRAFLRWNLALVLTAETLFALAFVAWAALRAYATFKINPAGGEKFMEIAFLNAILNSPQFPPLDPWMSGFAISYYYFGYVMMAVLTRLSGAAPGVAFDLYDALLFALAALGVFGVVYNLVAGRRRAEEERPGRDPLTFGVIGSLLVMLMGNLEGLVEVLHSRGLLSAAFVRWINIPDLANIKATGSWDPSLGSAWFWWWRSSRVIQDVNLAGQPVTSPITEYPFFSFLLGDNHPHVLALPFVLLSIALALNLLRCQFADNAQPTHPASATLSTPWWNPLAGIFARNRGAFLLYAIVLGGLGFLNTWDMPIYIGLVTLVYAAGSYARHGRLDADLVLRAAALAVSLLASGLLFYLFFYLSFSSQAGGILPYIFPPTRLPQFLLIFGIFIFILLAYLAGILWQASREQERRLLPGIVKSWGLAILAGILLLGLILVAVATGLRLAGDLGEQVGSALRGAIGSLNAGEAVRAILRSRLGNPWLFLLLALLLGLAGLGIAFARRRATLTSTNAYAQSNRADQFSPPPLPQSPAIPPSDLFAFVMIFVAAALTFSVEFFYLRDIFSVRMNTVFKFYYQAWVLMGCASAYALWWISKPGGKALGRLGSSLSLAGALALVLAGLVTPAFAIPNRVDGFKDAPNLDGASAIARDNPDDWAAIQWLRENAAPDRGGTSGQAYGNNLAVPVILEAPGGNYNYEGRISAFTGLPAVLGWASHEQQWRGTYDEQARRIADIQTIYAASDRKVTAELLARYHVRYVVLGQTEHDYIVSLCQDPTRACSPDRTINKFRATLHTVFSQGGTTIFEVP